MSEPIILTREELYEMVWTEPVSRIARRLGLSDVGIAKVCIKLGVPRPSRGYWARLTYGHPVERQPLPPPDDETPQEYLLHPQEIRKADATNPAEFPTVPIPEKVSRIHRVLVPMRARLTQSRKDSYGRVGTSEKGIHVSPQALPRVVRVLTIFFTFLEKRGHKISENEGQLEITVSGETIRVAVFEPTKRLSKGVSTYGYHQYDYRPSGMLTLSLSVPEMYKIRRQWADRKNKPIEQRLGVLAT